MSKNAQHKISPTKKIKIILQPKTTCNINNMNGYIYIRNHPSYGVARKLGKANNIPDRDNQYATGEIHRGIFELVIEMSNKHVGLVERLLQHEFKQFHIKYDAGTEFYNNNIITLIEPYLNKMGIKYKKLTTREIDNLVRINRIKRVKETFRKINTKSLINALKSSSSNPPASSLIPSSHQQYVLNMVESFYALHNKGKIIWACGLGKALLSVFIIKLLNVKTILFGVPSNYLQKQIKKEILKLFPTPKNILFVGGTEDSPCEDNKTPIDSFLTNRNNNPKFVITTYHSCYLLQNIMFDLKIGDEAHHLAGLETDTTKGFRRFHKIPSLKTLFMTATEKIIETNNNDKEKYSMNDENVFGKRIDTKTTQWAIEHKKITDYNILILKNTIDEVDNIIQNLGIDVHHKNIFISTYMSLKSFEKYRGVLSHILLYTNKIEDAVVANQYINAILDLNILSILKNDVYNNVLHSRNCVNLENEVEQFKEAKYGIISCVYIFGEGFDLPRLNGVCVAGNMQSEIRIAQYLLRPNRLEPGNPDKMSYIIIPYIDDDDWGAENKPFEKVRTIISQLRNEDSNIEQKIIVSIRKPREIEDEVKKNASHNIKRYNESRMDYQPNPDEILKFKIRLRYSKTLHSNFTEEQDEYNYARVENQRFNVQSIPEYHETKRRNHMYNADPENYFKSKGVWTNWNDFMGLDTSKFIQSKKDWIKFCKSKNIKSLEDYKNACNLYEELPKEPANFYTGFITVSHELKCSVSKRLSPCK